MKEKLTNEDYRHIAEVLLSMGTNINELPRTTETAGAISLPAVLDGKLVAVDLEQLLAALKAATTEAQSATSAALKAKVDTVAATAEASNAAEGANAVISEHAAVALRALMGATALFDDIIEDVTIQAANPSSETGGSVVYVRAKKQFAFKLLQGAVTTYYANWSNDVLYHEHDSYAIAKDKIYVDSTALYVWNEQLQDIKKVSSEAVVQLVQTITGDADKAPSAAAVFKALQGVQADIDAANTAAENANGKADGLATRVTKLEEGGVSAIVDKEVKAGSPNPVSGGAVYNALKNIIVGDIISESFLLNSAVRDEDGDVISAEIVYSDGKAGSITLTRDEDGDVSKVDGVYDKQTFTYNIERDTDGNVTSTNFEFL